MKDFLSFLRPAAWTSFLPAALAFRRPSSWTSLRPAALTAYGLAYPAIALLGILFAYRLTRIPSRLEAAAFLMLAFGLPTMRFPRFAFYFLLSIPCLMALFRRMYYLVADRPQLDFLMLISDAVMGGLILALLLLWARTKERLADPLSTAVLVYFVFLFVKIFAYNQAGLVEGLYGFKFNGLYVLFYFAAAHLLHSERDLRFLLRFYSVVLLFTAFYALKQVGFGFAEFERRWLDSISFVTLYIEGKVRPFSTFASPAALSDAMLLLLLLGLYGMQGRGGLTKAGGAFLALAAVPPLLLATVRTTWIAAMAGTWFMLVFLRLKKGWGRPLHVIAVMAACIYFSAQSQPAGMDYRPRAPEAAGSNLGDILIKRRSQALVNPLSEYSLQKRFEIWGSIARESLHFPLGKGQGTSGYAHSYYFQVLGELGYPGLIAFLVLLHLAFKRGFRLALRPDLPPEPRRTAAFLLTVLFVFSILNLTGTHLHTNPGDIFFWFCVGALSLLHRMYPEAR